MPLSYNNNTPKGNEAVSSTQLPILTNFQSVDTAFNGPTGAASGGGNFSTYALQNVTQAPQFAVKPVNPVGVLYTTNSSAGNPELAYINNTNATPGVAPFSGVRVTGGGITAAAWVRFNGTTAAIASSYNVTSITKNGVGDYTINFTRNFTNTDYSCVGSVQANGVAVVTLLDLFQVPTVSSWRVRVGRLSLGAGNPNSQTFVTVDSPIICLNFFGTLV